MAAAGHRAAAGAAAAARGAHARRARRLAQVAGRVPGGDRGAAPDVRRPSPSLAIHNAWLYQQLEAQGQALAEASQHKSQFLANMSHELRTPLNAIIGYSEMLQEEAEDLGEEAFIPDLQKVNAAGKHLLGLINDILDLSKIEAGRMDLDLETFEIAPMIQDVQAIVQPLVEKNGNTLVVTCPDDLGDDARRPDEGPAGAVQPALQRRQVHRARHDRVAGDAGRRPSPSSLVPRHLAPCHLRRLRHRDRDDRGAARAGCSRRSPRPRPAPDRSTAAPGSGWRSAATSAG